MAKILNEKQIGAVEKYNGAIMFRKYDSSKGFETIFLIDTDAEGNETLDKDNNIVIPYIEYFKNSQGEVIDLLTVKKYYVISNRPAVHYQAGEIITPAVMDGQVEITPAVIADGTEIKVPAWNAANDWFMSMARTPIQAPYGIIDGIEATLVGLPIDVPNGYNLTQPL